MPSRLRYRRELAGKRRWTLLDGFTRADGALGNGWTGSTWAISSNKAVNTPTLGVELVSNGDFSSDATGWTASSATLASVAGGQAGNALRITNTAANGYAYQSIATTLNAWYAASMYEKDGSHGVYWRLESSLNGADIYAPTGFSNAGWVQNPATFRALGAATIQRFVNAGGSVGNTALVDTVSLKALTLAELFATQVSTRSDLTIAADLTLTNGTQVGVVLNLDNAANPQNFVIAYLDGSGNAKLAKCVNGTYTTVISAAVTYGAGRTLQVVKVGTSYTLNYNGTQVGTTQTISDAGIINNRIHGMFSTHSGNSIDNWKVS